MQVQLRPGCPPALPAEAAAVMRAERPAQPMHVATSRASSPQDETNTSTTKRLKLTRKLCTLMPIKPAPF